MAEDLVEVAFVGNEHEAAVIQSLLEASGIPSLQQNLGPSGPLVGHALLNPGGGQRRIMVYARHAEEAASLLAEATGEDGPT